MLDAAGAAFADDESRTAARELVARALEIAREAAGDLRDLIVRVSSPRRSTRTGSPPPCASSSTASARGAGVAVEIDVQRATRSARARSSGLYQIVREALDQAVRRGPPQPCLRSRLEQTSVGGVALGARGRRCAGATPGGDRRSRASGADDLNATLLLAKRDRSLRTTIRVTLAALGGLRVDSPEGRIYPAPSRSASLWTSCLVGVLLARGGRSTAAPCGKA